MIKFGPSGNSDSFYEQGYTSTLESAKWCKERGLDLFEYSFGRGINIGDATAKAIGNQFSLHDVEVSAHAPYYINFANPDDEFIEKSIMYITRSIEKVKLFQGNRVIFHPASQGKVERGQAINRAKETLKKLMDKIDEKSFSDFILCPETMGKLGQIGTVEEIIDFCQMASYFYPCVDFGHVNAREQGILKTVKDFENVIDKLLDNLPSEKVKYMHIHFSKIEYGAKGEIKHLTFEDKKYGPEFEPLAEVLLKKALEPHIICESVGVQAEDAIQMKKIYMNMLTK